MILPKMQVTKTRSQQEVMENFSSEACTIVNTALDNNTSGKSLSYKLPVKQCNVISVLKLGALHCGRQCHSTGSLFFL